MFSKNTVCTEHPSGYVTFLMLIWEHKSLQAGFNFYSIRFESFSLVRFLGRFIRYIINRKHIAVQKTKVARRNYNPGRIWSVSHLHKKT